MTTLEQQAPCRKCGGAMKPGKAIQQTFVGGIPDWPNTEPGGRGDTMLAGGPGRLVDCLKCEKCGHSVRLTGECSGPPTP